MRRLLPVLLLALLSSACVHRWVGRPVTLLEKEYGSPNSIQRQGDNSIYYYPDFLAGRGEMTFTVDGKGIIRSWCATTDVPSPWLDDILGNSADGTFGGGINDINNRTNGGVNNTGSTNGLGGRRPQALSPNTNTCR